MSKDLETFIREFSVPQDVADRISAVGFSKVAENLFRAEGYAVPEEGMTEKAAVQIIGENFFRRRSEARVIRDGLHAIESLAGGL